MDGLMKFPPVKRRENFLNHPHDRFSTPFLPNKPLIPTIGRRRCNSSHPQIPNKPTFESQAIRSLPPPYGHFADVFRSLTCFTRPRPISPRMRSAPVFHPCTKFPKKRSRHLVSARNSAGGSPRALLWSMILKPISRNSRCPSNSAPRRSCKECFVDNADVGLATL